MGVQGAPEEAVGSEARRRPCSAGSPSVSDKEDPPPNSFKAGNGGGIGHSGDNMEDSFTHLFNRHMLNTYDRAGEVPDAGHRAGTKTNETPAPPEPKSE